MPAQTSPPPGAARPPAAPVRQRFRPVPARRGQTAPPHTAHPDQQNAQGREAQLPGRPGAAVGPGGLAAARHRRALLMAAGGTARITQLRRAIYRTRRGQPPAQAMPAGQPTAPGKKEQRPC
jgi:hypothetical protein